MAVSVSRSGPHAQLLQRLSGGRHCEFVAINRYTRRRKEPLIMVVVEVLAGGLVATLLVATTVMAYVGLLAQR